MILWLHLFDLVSLTVGLEVDTWRGRGLFRFDLKAQCAKEYDERRGARFAEQAGPLRGGRGSRGNGVMGSGTMMSIPYCVVLAGLVGLATPTLASVTPVDSPKTRPRGFSFAAHLQGPPQVLRLWAAADRADAAGQYALALSLLAELERLTPSDVSLHTKLGVVHLSLLQYEKAVAAFRKASSLAPKDPGIATNLGMALLESGAVAMAEREMSPWAGRIGDCAELGLLLARIALARERLDKAGRYIDAALKGAGTSAPFFFDAGQVLRRLGRNREAEAALRQAIREDPDLVPAGVALVEILVSSGRLNEADRVIEDHLRRNPNHPFLLVARAGVRQARGQLEAAVFDLDRAAALNPDLAAATLESARCLVKLHRLQDAQLRLAALLDPSRATPISPQLTEEAAALAREIGPWVEPSPAGSRSLKGVVAKAAERTASLRPTLGWLVWDNVSARNSDEPAFVHYSLVTGSSGGEVCVSLSQTPYSPGCRPSMCPEISRSGPPPRWAAELEELVRTAFPGTGPSVGWSSGWISIGGWIQSNVWVDIKGMWEGAATSARMVEWGKRLGVAAQQHAANPDQMMRELHALLVDRDCDAERARFTADWRIAPHRAVTLNLAVCRSARQLPSPRYPALETGGTTRWRTGTDLRLQEVRWIGAVPCVATRFEVPAASGSVVHQVLAENESRHREWTAFVGAYEVTLISKHPDADRTLPEIMREALRRLFPRLRQ